MPLNTKANLGDADGFYESLVGAHDGLTAAQSEALNARLILLLANHIGDLAVLRDAITKARQNIPK
jgi:hypothetical protein